MGVLPRDAIAVGRQRHRLAQPQCRFVAHVLLPRLAGASGEPAGSPRKRARVVETEGVQHPGNSRATPRHRGRCQRCQQEHDAEVRVRSRHQARRAVAFQHGRTNAALPGCLHRWSDCGSTGEEIDVTRVCEVAETVDVARRAVASQMQASWAQTPMGNMISSHAKLLGQEADDGRGDVHARRRWPVRQPAPR
jgi:hypothetical protein